MIENFGVFICFLKNREKDGGRKIYIEKSKSFSNFVMLLIDSQYYIVGLIRKINGGIKRSIYW